MNSSAIILLLLVPKSDVGGEVVKGVMSTLTTVEFNERLAVQVDADRPGRLDAKAVSRAAHAPNFAARVAWQDERRLSATLVVREVLPGSVPYHSMNRVVVFEPADSPREKGRALGLVLASMLRSLAGVPEPAAESAVPPSSEVPQRHAVRLLGALLLVSGGEWSAGGEVGYRLALSPHVGFRSAALLRSGRVSGITGAVSTVGAGIGGDYVFIRSPSWTVAMALDILAIRQGWIGQITAADDGGGKTGNTVHWNAIFRPSVEGQLRVSRWLSIVGVVGFEVAASKESQKGEDSIVHAPSQVYPLFMLGPATAF
jgi:hypothetical protein